MNPSITFLNGDRTGQRTELTLGATLVFGRDENADIVLAEKKVSRRHATLIWTGHRLVLEDLRSLNGTFVNGTQIFAPVDLRHCDHFQIGSFAFEVSMLAEKPASQRTTAPPIVLEESADDEIELTDLKEPEGEEPFELIQSPWKTASPQSHAEENLRTDSTSISGKLDEVALPDLLQLLASSKRSGKLVIVAKKADLSKDPPPGSGIIYLQEGQLISAEYRALRNEEAFYEIPKWNTGYFSLYYKEGTTIQKKIWIPLEALLLEGLRRLDEEKTHHLEFRPDHRFEVKLDEPLTSLEAEQLRIFQLVWKKKIMSEIWAASHLDQSTTDAVIRQLIRLGFIVKQPDRQG